jgi:hypothetical protein
MTKMGWVVRQVQSVRAAAIFAVALLPAAASAAEQLLSVDWSNAELKNFAAAKSEAAARGAAPQAPSRLDKVKLPVLGFEGAPGLVQNSFPGLGPQPMGTRDVHTDETNPVWYQIVDTYGDVTVSVAADLRVQHSFGADYPVYQTTGPGAAPTAGPEVSVFDENDEQGMEGSIAEYTVVKFGVPYTVTIECTAATKAQCQDIAQIAKDSALLKVIAATPPG